MFELLFIASAILNICLIIRNDKARHLAYHRGRRAGQRMQNMRILRDEDRDPQD